MVARSFAVCLVLFLSACEMAPEPPKKGVLFSPVGWQALPAVLEDSLAEALPALVLSCDKFAALPADRPIGPEGLGGSAGEWAPACARIAALAPGDETSLRAVLETEFTAFLVSEDGRTEGLFTGYYEAELTGSRNKPAVPATPLYGLPDDLVRVDLGLFGDTFGKKKVLGRVDGRRLVPYYDREQIDGEGALAGRGLELLWAHDPVEAFFLHVQGSGRVKLDDGSVVRVGFAGSNGLPFTGIGRLMLDEGIIPPSEASAQGIKAWLRAHPSQAEEILFRNDRYIFFRVIEGDGPIGSQGVALTPGRSLAIDPAFIPLGAPLFLETTWPGSERPLRRLVVAQDTGSAIKGPVRGDLFWGYGAPALEQAGRMKQSGRYYLLLPKAVGGRLVPSS
jgi:membrane-bound lytic murein transglycosylase A